MEIIEIPVCDKCGCQEFNVIELEKPKPEKKYVPASQYYKTSNWYSTSIRSTDCYTLIPKTTKKAVCNNCGAEYLY